MPSLLSQPMSAGWSSTFLAFGVFLALELVAAAFIMLLFKMTVDELVGPYLAFAMPTAIFLVANRALLIAEKRGVSPKRLALGWGLAGGLFATGSMGACYFSGQRFGLINLEEMGNLVFAAAMTIISCSIGAYWARRRRIGVRINF